MAFPSPAAPQSPAMPMPAAPDADAGDESAEADAAYPVEIQLEGEELDVNAPDGVDLASLPTSGTALVHYSLECTPDGGGCRILLSKICLPKGDSESGGEADGDEAGESVSAAKPGSFAKALGAAMGAGADDGS